MYGRVYPALIAIVLAVAARLKPVLDQLFKTVQARIIPVIQLVAKKFQEWWPTIQKVVSFVITLVGWVLKLAASILGKVLPVVIRFAGFLLTVVAKALIGVIEFVAKAIGALIRFGASVVNVVKKFVAFEVGVARVIGRVVRFFIDLPGKIVSAIGNVDDLLLGAGRKIIDGLLRGITEGFKKVKDKLGELTNKLPDWKGPRSKDKVILRDAGRLVISGFVGGMESQYADVRGSLQGLTRGLAAGAPALAAGAGAGGASGYARWHPHDLALLVDALASRPTVLDGRRVSESLDRALVLGVRP
jgi:phage-related protein